MRRPERYIHNGDLFRLRQNVAKFGEERTVSDSERLEFIERAAKRSRTGVSIEWSPEDGWRFMTFHKVDGGQSNIRAAIDAARALRPE
jgi:hypothetical protein